jgi:RNA polymerase sigma-70 factor, ECF subfamily
MQLMEGCCSRLEIPNWEPWPLRYDSWSPRPEKRYPRLLYEWRREGEQTVSGESLPLGLPFPRLRARTRETTTLYRELRKPLLRYLVSIGLSVDEAEDVVQDAFVSLERHLAAGGSQENIRSWLYRLAHNRARNRQTSYDRRFARPLGDEIDTRLDERTPERALLEREKLRHLASAIRVLSEQERECLLLRGEGLRYREIGEVLGIPTSTVGDTVERAIKKLAEKCNV